MCYGGCNCKRCMGEDDKMNKKRWVQHISGQGEKWEVEGLGESKVRWITDGRDGLRNHLPKSEYILCNPPEEWENVTGEYLTNGFVIGQTSSPEKYTWLKKGDRIRKVKLLDANYHPTDAFIVKRKKS